MIITLLIFMPTQTVENLLFQWVTHGDEKEKGEYNHINEVTRPWTHFLTPRSFLSNILAWWDDNTHAHIRLSVNHTLVLFGLFVLLNDTWSQQGHSVSCITILFPNLQIIRSDIRPHTKWAVSLVIAYGRFNHPRSSVWVCMGYSLYQVEGVNHILRNKEQEDQIRERKVVKK